MASQVKAIPEGFHTITPYMAIQGTDRAIEFYKQAFGAEELVRMPGPDGKTIMHAELKIGDSVLFLSEECPGAGSLSPQSLKGTTISLHLYVEDVDSAFDRAVQAGAKVEMPLADMFWGDRFGKLSDPFGHLWSLATHKEDLTPEEMGKRQEAFFASMAQQQSSASAS